jgi:hypothetical protein
MGQRRDFRFDTNQPVGVTILGGASQDDTHLKGCMVNLSGRGLSLTTESGIPVGSAVRIDVNDNILLGEVCHSRQTGQSGFVCGVQLEQGLTSVEDLARLVARLMGEARQPDENPAAVAAVAQVAPQVAPKERSRLKALFSRF